MSQATKTDSETPPKPIGGKQLKILCDEWNKAHSKIWSKERSRLNGFGRSDKEAKEGAKKLAASKKEAWWAQAVADLQNGSK